MSNNTSPCIVITSGEPAGIGPDIILTLFSQTDICLEKILVLGDSKLFQSRLNSLGISLDIHCIDHIPEHRQQLLQQLKPRALNLLHHPCEQEVIAGQLNAANAAYVMNMLDTAIELCKNKICSAMVTCPIQKSILIDAGYKLQGHTEYLAQKCNVKKVVMLLANTHLKVALATTHLPLSEVSDAITHDLLTEQLTIIDQEFKTKFSIARPKIFVCGLNPHAGEQGKLGREEIDVIEPALNHLKQQGLNVFGPLSADTAFSEQNRKQADVFYAMYHDQGLPVLKALGFGDSINITLGLPIIRTSVDHGTALELAGTGNASHQSLLRAIEHAQLMAHSSYA